MSAESNPLAQLHTKVKVAYHQRLDARLQSRSDNVEQRINDEHHGIDFYSHLGAIAMEVIDSSDPVRARQESQNTSPRTAEEAAKISTRLANVQARIMANQELYKSWKPGEPMPVTPAETPSKPPELVLGLNPKTTKQERDALAVRKDLEEIRLRRKQDFTHNRRFGGIGVFSARNTRRVESAERKNLKALKKRGAIDTFEYGRRRELLKRGTIEWQDPSNPGTVITSSTRGESTPHPVHKNHHKLHELTEGKRGTLRKIQGKREQAIKNRDKAISKAAKIREKKSRRKLLLDKAVADHQRATSTNP